MEAEVRHTLVAILAADVAGYSRLMAADDTATVAALDASRLVFRDGIEAESGRVVDTAGDSVLAVFDTPSSAVRAAIAAQNQINETTENVPKDRQMLFRIGITLGEVIEKPDGTVYGDGVNIAARLEAASDPGGITISGTVYDHVHNRIETGYHDLGHIDVKNIPEPVRAYRVNLDGTSNASRRSLSTRTLAAAAAFLVLSIGIATWIYLERAIISPGLLVPANIAGPEDPILALPTGPSIAVLSFSNLGDDPDDEVFADGLTEDIITALSKFQDLFVIARNSTLKYKDQAIDIRQIGDELGVRYVLQGSLRRSGDKIRVSAQFLDAEDGLQIWGETYDRSLSASDIFEIQDDIRAHVVATLADLHGIMAKTSLAEAEHIPPEDLDAYRCTLRAFFVYDKVFTPEEHLRVRDCLEKAIEANPEYAEAWAILAWIYTDEDSFGFNSRPNSLDRALAAAERAVELDPSSQLTQWMLARAHFWRNELDPFFVGAERALAMNPNNSTVLALVGIFSSYAGRWDRGIAMVEKAAKLNPNHPGWYYFPLSSNAYRLGEYEQALEYAQLLNMPGFWWTHVFLAMIYGKMGKQAEAEVAVRRLLELYPDYAANVRKEWRKLNFQEELIDEFVDGLQKAGLDIPEEPTATD